MRLCAIRHPQPADVDGLCYGRLDVAVAPTVLSHCVDRLRTALWPLRHWRWWSSPASRCCQLAEQCRALCPSELSAAEAPVAVNNLFTSLSIDARLQEMNFGAWEGVPWLDIPRAELDRWAADFWHFRPPPARADKTPYSASANVSANTNTFEPCTELGELNNKPQNKSQNAAETAAELCARVDAFLADLLLAASALRSAASNPPGHLVFTHAGVIRALKARAMGMDLTQTMTWPVPYAQPIYFDF